MREYIECKCRKTAVSRCPWAAKIVKVDGGYLAFAYMSDYQSWNNNK